MAQRSVRRWHAGAVAAVAAGLLLSACSSSSTDSASSTTAATGGGSTSTTAGGSSGSTPGSTPDGSGSARPLRIMVTNDDGYMGVGLDKVVEGLRTLPDVEVVVVAPATDRTGTGPSTTDVPLTATDVTTLSGYPAKAVAGFPADTVIWAVDEGGLDEKPDAIVSGINIGQNLGPVVDLSGTVGAARAAGSRGIPALAASQGLATEPDWDAGVELVLAWVTEHREELLAGGDDTPATVENLNVPSCATGTLQELVEVPFATDAAGRNVLASDVDCTGTPADPADDVDAFNAGFPSLSDITPG
jgi:5'-nucleotidase